MTSRYCLRWDGSWPDSVFLSGSRRANPTAGIIRLKRAWSVHHTRLVMFLSPLNTFSVRLLLISGMLLFDIRRSPTLTARLRPCSDPFHGELNVPARTRTVAFPFL